jgi:hypothetical protein
VRHCQPLNFATVEIDAIVKVDLVKRQAMVRNLIGRAMLELRYQHVEFALAQIHRVNASGIKAFRARIRHLRNLGLPQLPKVGKGLQVAYQEQHVHQLFFALELEQCGLDPARAAAFVKKHWTKLKSAIAGWSKDGRERFLVIEPFFVSEAWLGETWMERYRVGRVSVCDHQELSELLQEWHGRAGGRTSLSGPDHGRLVILDVSRRFQWLLLELPPDGRDSRSAE